jgi:Ca2+-binding EF-hand superfamily protein
MGLGALALGLVVLPLGGRTYGQQKDLPGPIDSLQDLQDTGKMLFKLADENNDGQISQREAIDAGNLMVGGFFFRADTNGDGILSKQEIQQARDAMLSRSPLLRVLAQRARAADAANGNQVQRTAQNASQGLMSLIDSNNDGQIQATELRQMVQTSVQSVFAAADTNRDGQLSPTEVNAAIVGAIRAAAQATFQKADADNNGQLSQAEFDKALVQPANALFHMMDANQDGQISQQEAQAAMRLLANQARMLNVPEPANSARHLLQGGRATGEAAPVPNFNTNNNNARPAQPPQ